MAQASSSAPGYDDAGTPTVGAKPMDEVQLIAAIDDADNRAYGSNLSNLTAALSAERALNIDLYLGKNVDPARRSVERHRPISLRNHPMDSPLALPDLCQR